jgi:hypothetical protein
MSLQGPTRPTEDKSLSFCFLLIVLGIVKLASDAPQTRVCIPLGDYAIAPPNLTVLVVTDIQLDEGVIPTNTPLRPGGRPVRDKPYPFGWQRYNSPRLFLPSLLSHAHKVVPNPDCIIFGADMTRAMMRQDQKMVLSLFHNVTRMLTTVYPNVPLYPIIGNHQLDQDKRTLKTDPANFKAVSRVLVNLTDAERTTFERGGYYYHDFQNFRFLFLNTPVYRGETSDHDPWGQFGWMDSVCEEAQASGMTIGAVTHAPAAGVTPTAKVRCTDKWQCALDSRLTKYDIRFMFSGHPHQDLVLWARNAADLRDSLTEPPVVTVTGNKIGFRVYQIGRAGVLNYQQYSADKFSQSGGESSWKLEYEFRETYDPSHASLESVKKVAELVESL